MLIKSFTFLLLLCSFPLKAIAYILGVIAGNIVDGFLYGWDYGKLFEDKE